MADRSEGPRIASPKLTPVTPTRGKPTPASKPASDTPRSRANVANGSTMLTKLRPQIAFAMNEEFFTCDHKVFFRHYLPPYDQKTVEQVRDSLIANGEMAACSDKPNVFHFTQFNQKPSERKRKYDSEMRAAKKGGQPAPKLVDEKTIFNSLEDITDAIIVCLGDSQEHARLYLQMCPDARLGVEVYGGNQRIDGAVLTKKLDVINGKMKGRLSVNDILVPLEFKIFDKEEQQNHLQLASHVNFTMDADPRRNFVIGITIEDDQVSLWYFSRNHSVKSSSFSIIEQPDEFIALMISLLSASLSDLGFDPRITLHPDGQSYVYEFTNKDTTKSRFFKTLATIDERRHLRLTTRCTRVWKVMEIASRTGTERKDSSAVDMVLKDVWLDASAKTEKEIQDELFKDIRQFASYPGGWETHPRVTEFSAECKEEFSSALEGENFKEYFLCISDSHVGDPCKIVAPEANRDHNVFATDPVDVFGSERLYRTQDAPSVTPEAALSANKVGSVGERSVGEDEGAGEEDEEGRVNETEHGAFPDRKFPSKRRCFSLSNLLCTALHDLETLGEAFDVLRHAAIALLLMFCAGWVHRDVSSGNILAYPFKVDGAWQGKLHDLEYAKRFDPFGTGSSEPKTGTPYFMPLEILQGCYFLENKLHPRATGYVAEEVPNNRAVVHNPEHDFECLWWIGLWLVTRRVKDKPISAYGSVFSSSLKATSARTVFFTRGVPDISKQVHSSLNGLAAPLNFLRVHLYSECMRINASDVLPSNTAEEIASRYSYVVSTPFFLFFREIDKTRSEWGKIQITPISANPKIHSPPLQVKPSEVVTKTRTARKRKSAQTDEEPGVEVKGSRPKKTRPLTP